MNLSISTNYSMPTTKLTKKQLSDLEDRLEESEYDRETIIDVATILRDNTTAYLIKDELDRMIYMLKEKKGKVREIQSIVLRTIMTAVPFTNGGRRLKRRTIKKRKYTKRK